MKPPSNEKRVANEVVIEVVVNELAQLTGDMAGRQRHAGGGGDTRGFGARDGKARRQRKEAEAEKFDSLRADATGWDVLFQRYIHVVSLGDTFRNAGRQRDSDLGN